MDEALASIPRRRRDALLDPVRHRRHIGKGPLVPGDQPLSMLRFHFSLTKCVVRI